eukprot:250760-Chlamydomonas_euryale.AAC.1
MAAAGRIYSHAEQLRERRAATMHGNSKEGSAAAMLSSIRSNQLLTCMAAAEKASCSHPWE